MGFLDDFLLLQSDYDQQRDINALKFEVNNQVDLSPVLSAMSQRIGKLELLNRALIEVMISKGLLQNADLSVMMQQVDLLDGVEDGKVSAEIHQGAPSCNSCGKYVNPKRENCVYCGEVVSVKAKRVKISPLVECSRCTEMVPEASTYFAGSGVMCEPCFETSGE